MSVTIHHDETAQLIVDQSPSLLSLSSICITMTTMVILFFAPTYFFFINFKVLYVQCLSIGMVIYSIWKIDAQFFANDDLWPNVASRILFPYLCSEH